MAREGTTGPGAGDIRLNTGALLVGANVIGLRNFGRNSLGRFNDDKTKLKKLNERLATELQEEVAAALDRTRVSSRRGVSSGRLKEAILDPKNREIKNEYFAVGIDRHMDRSAAKYWRQIESGTSIHVGQRMPTGVWGSSLTGGEASARSGPYPIAGGSIRGYGADRSGRLRPMGPTYAYRALVGAGMTKRAAYTASRAVGIIRNPIEAEHYFLEGWRDFDGPARSKKEWNAFIREIVAARA